MFLRPVFLSVFVVDPVLPVFDSMFMEVLDEGVSVNACSLVCFVPFMPRCFCRKVNESVVNEGWKKYFQMILFFLWDVYFSFTRYDCFFSDEAFGVEEDSMFAQVHLLDGDGGGDRVSEVDGSLELKGLRDIYASGAGELGAEERGEKGCGEQSVGDSLLVA